jgi:hypothetical protein
MDTTCNEARKAVKQVIGWNFFNVLFACFGNISITLKGEAANGGDLEFAVSREWVDANRLHPPDSQEGYDKLSRDIQFVSNCKCEECTKTRQMISLVAPYCKQGKSRKIPGGDALLMISQFSPGGIATSRSDAPDLVDEFKPFLEMLANEPDLWKQPEGQ